MSDDETGPIGPDAEDISLPKTTVHKLVQSHLGEGVVCAKDAKDLIADCAKEFISLIASEANEVCEKASKKMLGPEHIVAALKTLGYENFAGPVEEVMKDNTAAVKSEKERKSSSKADKSGMTQEELEAAQERLFAAHRAEYAGEAS